MEIQFLQYKKNYSLTLVQLNQGQMNVGENSPKMQMLTLV